MIVAFSVTPLGVSLVLKADINPGVSAAITSKVAAVERYLAE